jgi:hypothetical protein
MNKKIIITVCCCLLTSLILVSCASTNKKQNFTSSGKQPVNQNLRSLTVSEIKTPDKIIFYHNGKQTVFTKKDPQFLNIIKLNNQRKIVIIDPKHKGLGLLLLALSSDEILKSDVLVYNYDQSKYFPIYFPLIMNEKGKFYVAQSTLSTGRICFNVYGWLSSPQQLLDYLNG